MRFDVAAKPLPMDAAAPMRPLVIKLHRPIHRPRLLPTMCAGDSSGVGARLNSAASTTAPTMTGAREAVLQAVQHLWRLNCACGRPQCVSVG